MTGNQKHPNLLHTLRTGQMNNYTFRLPYTSATATTPGVYLPKVMQAKSQALFGSSANKAGSPAVLEYLSKAVPTDWAPSYLTSDCKAMSSSCYSNFRKSAITTQKGSDAWVPTQTAEYRAPPAGWECAACGPPNPHVKPYGRYKRALEAAEKERQQLEMLRSQVQRPYSSLF